jgi:lysozyme
VKKQIILFGLLGAGLLAARHAAAAISPQPEISTGDPNESAGVLDEIRGLADQVQGALGGGMRMSAIGLEVLKREEGFRGEVYYDAAGYPTIGYGHKLLPGESFDTIDQARATELLANDLGSAEDAVNGAVSILLAQGQFDALVSFTYNVGNAAFRASTLLRKVNDEDPTALNEFARWRYITVNGVKQENAGLVSRRQSESNMFQGIYA